MLNIDAYNYKISKNINIMYKLKIYIWYSLGLKNQFLKHISHLWESRNFDFTMSPAFLDNYFRSYREVTIIVLDKIVYLCSFP